MTYVKYKLKFLPSLSFLVKPVHTYTFVLPYIQLYLKRKRKKKRRNETLFRMGCVKRAQDVYEGES